MTALLSIVSIFLLAASAASAQVYKASLGGAQTKATGVASITLINATFATGYFYSTKIKQMTQAHLHTGAVGKNGPSIAWAFNATYGPLSGSIKASFTFDPSVNNISSLLAAGLVYFNVHTVAYPTGELRGQFAPTSSSDSSPTPLPNNSYDNSPTSSKAEVTMNDIKCYGFKPTCTIIRNTQIAADAPVKNFSISCPVKDDVILQIARKGTTYGRSDVTTCPYDELKTLPEGAPCNLDDYFFNYLQLPDAGGRPLPKHSEILCSAVLLWAGWDRHLKASS